MSFRIAEKQAKKSSFLKHRVGAVIMKGSRVISTGFNSIRYNRFSKRPTAHAEAAAITNLLRQGRMDDLCNSDIYVTRFTKSGNVSCAAPCIHCRELIQAVGIRKIFYTDFDGKVQEVRV